MTPVYIIVRENEHTCVVSSPPVESVDDVASKSSSVPLSQQEDKLATSLLRRKLAQESQDGRVRFKTGGQVFLETTLKYIQSILLLQPITLLKATGCRVPSSQATPKTVSGRTKELAHHRSLCSGGDQGDQDQGYQLGKEVKACTREEREEILKEVQDGFVERWR